MGCGPSAVRAFWLAMLAATGTVADTGCQKLCQFDEARTHSCHVSREYVAALVGAFDNGPWAKIMSQQALCEAHVGNCLSVSDCEFDDAGICAATRSWIARILASPVADGGAGLNADSCGLFGQLLATGAGCLARANKTACTAGPWTTSSRCAWDPLRNVCDASRQDLLLILRRDYPEDLARVNLRRQRCAAQTRQTCIGDCRLVNGTCVLRALNALLAITGEDCPLSSLFTSHAGCGVETDQSACTSRTRSDGRTECAWRRGQCEAHPMALEFDLIGLLGLSQPAILGPMSAAEAQCSAMAREVCNATCAPRVRSSAAVRRTRRTTAIVLSAVVGIWGTRQQL